MAMIVRLLNNRSNPCRGLLDHLKLRPCNFIQTQTLSSTGPHRFHHQLVPLRYPRSNQLPSISETSFPQEVFFSIFVLLWVYLLKIEYFSAIFFIGLVIRSLRDCMHELSRRHNGMHSIKSIVR